MYILVLVQAPQPAAQAHQPIILALAGLLNLFSIKFYSFLKKLSMIGSLLSSAREFSFKFTVLA
jgi:hypothetical protein